jgi:hypothetical protein
LFQQQRTIFHLGCATQSGRLLRTEGISPGRSAQGRRLDWRGTASLVLHKRRAAPGRRPAPRGRAKICARQPKLAVDQGFSFA